MNKNSTKNKSELLAIKQKTEEWGKVKFKPTIKTTKVKSHKFDRKRTKCSNTKQTDPKLRNANYEAATPWKTFKNDMMLKQQEDQRNANALDMESKEAKEALRQREINYRRILMKQKQEEPVKWEDFSEKKADVKMKRKRNKKYLSGQNEIAMQIACKNFDNKQLGYEQNDQLRRMITKSTVMLRGCKLKQSVQNMQYWQKKKATFKQSNQEE